MKTILFAVILLQCSNLFAAAPSKFIDGRIKFAVGNIDGKDYFDQTEFDDVVATDSGSLTSTTYTPTAFELGIVNSGIKFENYSDYEQCVNNKGHLADKILDIRPSVAVKKQAEIAYIETENAKKP